MDSKTNNAFSICNTQLLKCMVDLPTFRPLFMVNVYHEPPKPWGFGHPKTRLFTVKTSMGAHGRYKYTKNHWVSVLVTPCRRWKPSTKKTKKNNKLRPLPLVTPLARLAVALRCLWFGTGFMKRWPIYGGFLKWWVSPTTMGFPTKNDHFEVFWGYHHFRKPPYIYHLFLFPQHLAMPASYC